VGTKNEDGKRWEVRANGKLKRGNLPYRANGFSIGAKLANQFVNVTVTEVDAKGRRTVIGTYLNGELTD
jgi:hypothetical protein